MNVIQTLNRFETHDRLLDLRKKSDYISQGCQDCIKNRPTEFKQYPFYIYAHARTEENGYDKRLIWVPRLTKPLADSNSMLFRCYPDSDTVKILWILPDERMWDQFSPDKMTHDPLIWASILAFKANKKKMSARESDDLSEEQINKIYKEIRFNVLENQERNKTVIQQSVSDLKMNALSPESSLDSVS